MRHRRDLFVASRNPFAARWSTLSPLSLAQTPPTVPVADSPADADPDEDEVLEGEDDDQFDDGEDDDTDDEVAEDADQTAEPEGQFPAAPDALKDAERPGAL